jgi:excisionase family DNA binding protein
MKAATDRDGEALPPLTIRVAQAAELTGLSRSKLYELIRAQEIEVIKIGASTLVIYESLRRLVERHRRERE